MTKFLLLLFAIFALAILGLTYIFKRVRRFFEMFAPKSGPAGQTKSRRRDADVVYEQDDVVVLKGEAGKKKKQDTNGHDNPR